MSPVIDPYHMRSQPQFRSDKLEKGLALVFEIQFNIMICCPKTLLQFVQSLDFKIKFIDHVQSLTV